MKLTQAQSEYLINHDMGDHKELAKATGLTVLRVKNFLKTLPKTPVQEKAPEPVISEKDGIVKIGHYGVKDGSVVMTPGQSTHDDEHPTNSEDSMKRYEKDIDRTPIKNKRILPKE